MRDGNIANQATEVKMTFHIRFVELCKACSYCWWWYFQSGNRSKNDRAYRICINICYKQLCPPNTLATLNLAGPKQDFAPCHRHPPAKKEHTSSLQNTELDILPLLPLLFDKGFTMSKLRSFPSWETIADRRNGCLLCCQYLALHERDYSAAKFFCGILIADVVLPRDEIKRQNTVCNFQSMKTPVELDSLLSKFFCYITWFVISAD